MKTITVKQLRQARIQQQQEAKYLELILDMPKLVLENWVKVCEFQMGITQNNSMSVFAMLLAMSED